MSLQKLAAIVAHKYLCWSVSSHSRDCVCIATPVDWLEMQPLVSATNQAPVVQKVG